MATSGSVDFGATRDDIITEALELLGVLGEGDSPNADQLTSSARTLNMMVKAWQNRCKNLHVSQELFLFQDGSSQSYLIDGSTDHVTSSYAATTLSADSAASDTTLTVTSITGFTNGDQIGIELDDGTREWTTINGAPSGSTITITTGLTSAATTGNTVFAYTTKANKPVRIDHVYVRDLSVPTTPMDTPIELMNRSDYMELSNKTTTGRGTALYADYQRTATKLFPWPVASTVDQVIGMRAWRTIEDFDAASDDADFPQEWYLALSYNLAANLAPKYGYPALNLSQLKNQAEIHLFDAESHETEESMQLMPDVRSGYW